MLEAVTDLPPLKVRTEDETSVLLAQCQRRLSQAIDATVADTPARALARAVHARAAALESLVRMVQLLRPTSDDPTWAKAGAEARVLAGHLRTCQETVVLGAQEPTAGYHVGLLRALAGTAPPRTLPRMSRAQAYTDLVGLADDLGAACAMAAATSLLETTVRAPTHTTAFLALAAGGGGLT